MDHSIEIDVRMEEPYYHQILLCSHITAMLHFTRYATYDTVCDSTARIKQKMYLDYQQQRQQRNVNFQMEA